MITLDQIWFDLANRYNDDTDLIQKLWTEIEINYSAPTRHYHALSHIKNMIELAIEHKNHIDDFDTFLFSIFYHDIIYNAKKKDNEEKSAELASVRLFTLSIEKSRINKCTAQILATKSHQNVLDNDTKLLLDIDLSVLGSSWKSYQEYFKGVRKEYSMYPDLLYQPGRKKVLKHFLKMERIFQTSFMYDKYELTARENLKRELDL